MSKAFTMIFSIILPLFLILGLSSSCSDAEIQEAINKISENLEETTDIKIFSGSVNDGSNPIAEASVRLYLADEDGNLSKPMGITKTNSEGNFTLSTTYVTETDLETKRPYLKVRTEEGNELTALIGNDKTEVSPSSKAVAKLMFQISSSPEGISLFTDFSNDEITEFTTGARNLLQIINFDQTNPDNVYDRIRYELGEAIADASESSAPTIGLKPRPNPETPDNNTTDINFENDFDIKLENDAEWDIQTDGSIAEGSEGEDGDAFDSMFIPLFSGEDTPGENDDSDYPKNNPNDTDPQGWIEDEREVVLGPYGIAASDCNDGLDNDEDGDTDGEDEDCEEGMHENSEIQFSAIGEGEESSHDFVVMRKIYIPESGNWARFVEFLKNNTEKTVYHNVMVSGDLDSDGDEYFGPSSSGDNQPDIKDSWHTSVETGYDPALGFLYPGATVTGEDGEEADREDQLEFHYENINILPGKTVAIVTFGFQDPDGENFGDMEVLADQMSDFMKELPNKYFEGLTTEEINQIYNLTFSTVSGKAGSVAPEAKVTVTNKTTGATSSALANEDGSFEIRIKVSSADEVMITTNFDRKETIIIE